MRRFQNLILLLLFCAGNVLLAQNPYAIIYDKTKGFPSNEIFDVLQDDDGMIWYATAEGLTSFDGKINKTYLCNEQTSSAGSNIKKDRFGRIWYENFDGFLYYLLNDTLKGLNQNPPITYIPYGITQNHLFVSQKTGIDIYDLKSLKRIKTIVFDTMEIQSAYADDQNYYFIIHGLLYKINYNLQLQKTKKQVYESSLNSLILVHEKSVFILPQGRSNKQILVYNANLEYVTVQNISETNFSNGLDFIDNKLWLHTNKGSFIYEFNNGKLNLINQLFSGYKISKSIKDYQNNYWFATLDNGLLLSPSLDNKEENIASIKAHKIISVDNGYLFATLDGNLVLKNKTATQTLLKPPLSSNIYYLYQDPENKNLFYSHFGFSVASQSNFANTRHYASALKKVIKLDHKYYAIAMSGYVSLFLSPSPSLKSKSSWDDYFKRQIDPKDNDFARIQDKTRAKTLAYNPETETILYASNSGLFKVNTKNSYGVKFNNLPFYAKEIEYFDNIFYILSSKGNLYKLDEKNQFEVLNDRLNIPNNSIINLKINENYIYFYTASNFYSYELKSQKPNILNIKINPNEILDFTIKADKLALLTNKSILEFSLKSKPEEAQSIKFKFGKLEVGSMSYSTDNIIQLNYDNNNIKIHFSIFDYGKGTPIQLFYQLNNDDWLPISTDQRELQFLKLASGSYVLKIKLNNQIIAKQLKFTIASPFWRTQWFLIFIVITIGGFTYLFYRWRVKRISKEFKLKRDKLLLEKELSQSVLTSIKSQMNPHFFYNALNTIQSFLFTNDKRNASNYLSKFSKLTRMILEMSGQETIKLQEEIEALKLYLELEKMRFEDDFHFQMEISETVDLEMIKIPSMLIQPYVENAVKHGLLHVEGPKHLSIHFSIFEGALKVTIIDNGIGRTKAESFKKLKADDHKSYATEANLKRLELLNRGNRKQKPIEITDVLDSENRCCGTQVILYIPIS